MAEELSDVDKLLLERWADATGIREAIEDLEKRLGDRLEAFGEELRPWLEQQGFLMDTDRKAAGFDILRPVWRDKKKGDRVWLTIGGLFPYGYRKVTDEHPFVWVIARGLEREDQEEFQRQLTERLRNKSGSWFNEACSRDEPAGRFIEDFGDAERARLAQSTEETAAFVKRELPPLLALADDVEAALKGALGK